jgi:hypothetical protein
VAIDNELAAKLIDSPASRLIPTKETLFNKIFCAPKDMTRDEVQREIDKYHLSGTSGGWQLVHQDDNPIDCEQDKTKQHWLCVT